MSEDATIAVPRRQAIVALAGMLVLAACSGGGGVDATTASTTPTTMPGRLTTTTTSTIPATTATIDPGEVRAEAIVEAGLAAWGQYAVSGETALLSRYFSTAGPQYRLFQTEAEELSANPLGSPPYLFTLTNVAYMPTIGQGARDILRADVQVTREGEETQEFSWDLHLDQSAAGVTIWTISDTHGVQAVTGGNLAERP